MAHQNSGDGRLRDLLGTVKDLAREYYELTGGRSLGVTGEVAEYEAARLVGVRLAPVRQSGFDAWRDGEKLQIKGCCVSRSEASWRMGAVRLDREWDWVLLVLMNRRYDAYEIWDADRETLTPALEDLGSRGMPVKHFKQVGRRLWRASRPGDPGHPDSAEPEA